VVGGLVALDDAAEFAVDTDRDIAGDRHPVQQTRQVAVVVRRVVLGAAVVEQDQVGQLAQRFGEILVGGGGVGDQGVAAVGTSRPAGRSRP
ncbi:hypothetical protein HRW10_33560, partial [Streptomyces lunaelactis]|nr:hypothetical protein [Streptomyces lunaelactis]